METSNCPKKKSKEFVNLIKSLENLKTIDF